MSYSRSKKVVTSRQRDGDEAAVATHLNSHFYTKSHILGKQVWSPQFMAKCQMPSGLTSPELILAFSVAQRVFLNDDKYDEVFKVESLFCG